MVSKVKLDRLLELILQELILQELILQELILQGKT